MSEKEPVISEAYLRDYLVNLWLKDQGQRETHGKNKSPMINAVNRRLHVPLGSPYCIGALLVRGVEVMCTVHKLQNPVIMTAGTQNFWWKTPVKYRREKGELGQKADIGILVNKSNPAFGHAYGLTKNQTDPKLQATIEYNTSKAGSRDGDGVYQLIRSQDGTGSKTYRGCVDVVQWICDVNGIV